MVKKPILNLHSDKPRPPRVFDVIIDDNSQTLLQVKLDKNKYEYIPFDDVLVQVKSAQETVKQKLPQRAP